MTKTEFEVTILKLENDVGILYEVTRRVPGLLVVETRTYRSRESALRKFKDWFN